MVAAVIDVGSNSIRMMVANGGKTPRPLIKRIRITQLARGMEGTGGRLSYDAMAASIAAISAFRDEAQAFGKVPVAAFATAAVREAGNREEFLAAVKKMTGLTLDVLSGEEEAMLSLLGAAEGDGGVMDIGGASTEIICGKEGKMLYAGSFPVGCVRAKQMFSQEELQTDIGPFFDYLAEQFIIPVIQPARWLAVGGTVTTLAALKKGLSVYDPDVVHGCVIHSEDIPVLLKKVAQEEARAALPVLGGRKDVILHGTLIFGYLMALLGLDYIAVSEADNMEGYWQVCFGSV